MPLKLLPMEEADLDAFDEICWEAFKDGVMALMYPNGYGSAAKEWWKHYCIKDWREHPEKFKFMKVIDTSLSDTDPNGKVVGVSQWKFYLKDRTEAEMDAENKESEERGNPPGVNVPFVDEFFGNILKYKKQILDGRAYILLNILVTLPNHERRGVGALQLKWGNQEADRLGLPCYLEASPSGKPLYERYGYEFVSDFPFDARSWGLDRDLPHVCMLRPVKEMNGKP